MSSRIFLYKSLIILCTVGIVSACSTNATRYSSPSPQAAASVDLGTGSFVGAINQVTGKLTNAGFRIQSVNKRTGNISAVSTSPRLIDCGVITQTFDGSTVSIPGTAPDAILVAFELPGDLVRRQVSTRSVAEIKVIKGPRNMGQISETHHVTIAKHTVDSGRKVWSEAKSFAGDSVARFSDGTTCTSSGFTRRLIN